MYEIKMRFEAIDGRVVEESKTATSYERTTKGGLDAIKFLQPEKSRFTWYEIPNAYQMKNYYKSYTVTISEATTGKNIEKISA